MLYLIGGPSPVGKSTLASGLHEATGASLVATDAIVWMLQVAAPELGVRHGSESKAEDAARFVGPFVEAATVYGTRDLILEGDAIGPATAAELLNTWEDSRAVFLGAEGFSEADVLAGGGYVSTLEPDTVAALLEHIRRRSRLERLACEAIGIPYVDVSRDRRDAIAKALAFPLG